ncbi:hypothetical protein P0082_00515 [Candidatus Haliotispira prima]|uniref:DUF4382 domain-containing protein n=1 Tax=Candidatus Haliotispira prima TaxID=3034016 RepID=A0ABY8MH84_9SPIO|nr:hypothetical protein P0082_00515 [Candidatus Haliotispira prima]
MAQIVQYPISNIQYPISNQLLKPSFINFLFLFKFSPLLSRLFPSSFCFFSILFIHLFLSACAPISETGKDPAPNPDISFSVTAVASSVEFEVSSIPAVTDVGAVIRLAAEAVPTKAEAQESKGYVSLSIDADSTRKFSISQHYGSDFTDGLTLADVLSPNTSYKLYLFMPSEIDLAQTKIKGGEIKEDRIEVSFTTVSLPAEGDAKWLSSNGKCVEGVDTLYFMQAQQGVAVCYFYLNFEPAFVDVSVKNGNLIHNIGIYSTTSASGANFNFVYGPTFGYTSNSKNHYFYWMGADKVRILEQTVEKSITTQSGDSIIVSIPVTRY